LPQARLVGFDSFERAGPQPLARLVTEFFAEL
jgi:hypothetical protein